jgi:hypothetical protein
MLIPVRHENMSARRWPVVTFALIAINVVVFLFTHGTMIWVALPNNSRLTIGRSASIES